MQLRTVWREEWTAVVERHPEVAILSSEAGFAAAGDGSARQMYLPSKVVQQRAFPTVYAESLPSPGRHALRKWSVGRAADITSDEEKAIAAAIAGSAGWLSTIGSVLPRLERRVSARQLGVSSLRDGLLAIILAKVEVGAVLDDDEIDELVEPFLLTSGNPSPSAARSYLRDDARASDVADRLRRAGMPTPPPAGWEAELAIAGKALDGFLNKPTDAHWQETLDGQVDLWHFLARRSHLTAAEQPPLPPVRPQPEPNRLRPVPRLDGSIADRLAPALDFDILERSTMPPLTDFVEWEIVRATSHLGLSSVAGRAVIALGARIQEEYVDEIARAAFASSTRQLGGTPAPEPERTVGTLKVMRKIERWRTKTNAFESNASFPLQALENITNPQAWYMSYLWRRVHTREVGFSPIDTAAEAWRVLTEMSLTTVRNIYKKPWAAEGAGSARDVGETAAVDDATGGNDPLTLEDLIIALDAAGVGVHELAPFMNSDAWGSAEHREQWQAWNARASLDLDYAEAEDFWKHHRPR
ncbi:hypothetical protein RB608_10280 [Nocardioides sp. LHD-245]|uniref:hypothetical protein n=1 Tax=Nocardioides sp. LHD-245 TaxID=3051387 RepID=UPI0027E182E9|nr:hypothetical protein [Nocardioides sp. LHD-245]